MFTLKNIFHYVFALLLAIFAIRCAGSKDISLPGKMEDGKVRLPNGWFLTPAGKEIEVGDTPLNFDIDPSGEYAIVTNNGEGEQSVSIVTLNGWKVTQTIPVRKAWLGIKFFDGGKKFALSGGNDNRIFIYAFDRGTAQLTDSIVIGKPWPDEKIWIGGIDIDDTGSRMYATGRFDSSLTMIDLPAKKVSKKIHLPGMPYTCMVSRKHPQVYISLWGSSSILIYDRDLLTVLAKIEVGHHPNDMAESPDGKRLFVANANENTVSVIDINTRKKTETLSSALTPDAPAGSTPNSVALSPDGKILYIANADNNYLALMDVSDPTAGKSIGFIPVGWYPSCVRVRPGSGEIIVSNGKGNTSLPNPLGPQPGRDNSHAQYIGSLFKGTLEIISPPNHTDLVRYSTQVYMNTPYYQRRDTLSTWKDDSLKLTPIKHVFYVLKENRTYDQILGDMKEGNGDSSLTLFGEHVTPNIHALARQFVLLDNFYVDAEVSADGHNWSMAAYATDYVEKSWPTNYGGRGGDYDFEGGNPTAAPSSGYIWENCKAHNVTYRIYGEFVNTPDKIGDEIKPTMPSQEGHICAQYRGWDLSYSDLDREKVWEKEFNEYEINGDLPAFNVVYFPNDHTAGTSKGTLTPSAMIAQNDQALGMFIDRLSRSKYWKETAVFVIEDDAQNGPDHVDAHRSEALVISPYTKHHFVDHTLYSTSSMVRTMEMIFGLPPMTQFDASSTPMTNSFASEPDLSLFTYLPAVIDINEKNLASAYGTRESEGMDFTEPDEINEQALNEILWKSIKGAASEMPPPVRGAFVKDARNKEK
ncbi:MAG: bifunctional YncE family protein/alkaline phosphatase family protein [Bacteroidota bacterium]